MAGGRKVFQRHFPPGGDAPSLFPLLPLVQEPRCPGHPKTMQWGESSGFRKMRAGFPVVSLLRCETTGYSWETAPRLPGLGPPVRGWKDGDAPKLRVLLAGRMPALPVSLPALRVLRAFRGFLPRVSRGASVSSAASVFQKPRRPVAPPSPPKLRGLSPAGCQRSQCLSPPSPPSPPSVCSVVFPPAPLGKRPFFGRKRLDLSCPAGADSAKREVVTTWATV